MVYPGGVRAKKNKIEAPKVAKKKLYSTQPLDLKIKIQTTRDPTPLFKMRWDLFFEQLLGSQAG